MNTDALFSSQSVEWATPQWLFDLLDSEFHFTVDVCATPDNAKCKRYFTAEQDGLVQDWSREVCFCNPPYGRSRIGRWMQKAVDSARTGATVVCLVPGRPDPAWWWESAIQGEIRFLKGRLRFGNAPDSAPFPSAVVIFRPGVSETDAICWHWNARDPDSTTPHKTTMAHYGATKKRVKPETRQEVKRLHQSGETGREIARRLQIGEATVRRILAVFDPEPAPVDPPAPSPDPDPSLLTCWCCGHKFVPFKLHCRICHSPL